MTKEDRSTQVAGAIMMIEWPTVGKVELIRKAALISGKLRKMSATHDAGGMMTKRKLINQIKADRNHVLSNSSEE